MKALTLSLLLAGCTHLPAVEQGIRSHHLAGTWKSERGDRFQIGCSGAFSQDLEDDPVTTHETGAHISEVTDMGFTVSHWPMKDDYYDVAKWPLGETMVAEGMNWKRIHSIDCDAQPFWK